MELAKYVRDKGGKCSDVPSRRKRVRGESPGNQTTAINSYSYSNLVHKKK